MQFYTPSNLDHSLFLLPWRQLANDNNKRSNPKQTQAKVMHWPGRNPELQLLSFFRNKATHLLNIYYCTLLMGTTRKTYNVLPTTRVLICIHGESHVISIWFINVPYAPLTLSNSNPLASFEGELSKRFRL